jgi:hypothetical protein
MKFNATSVLELDKHRYKSPGLNLEPTVQHSRQNSRKRRHYVSSIHSFLVWTVNMPVVGRRRSLSAVDFKPAERNTKKPQHPSVSDQFPFNAETS